MQPQARIEVYFLTDAQIIRDNELAYDIWEAKNLFSKVALKAEMNNDTGKVIMRFTNGDIIKTKQILPQPRIENDIADFNKRFGNL